MTNNMTNIMAQLAKRAMISNGANECTELEEFCNEFAMLAVRLAFEMQNQQVQSIEQLIGSVVMLGIGATPQNPLDQLLGAAPQNPLAQLLGAEQETNPLAQLLSGICGGE